jgi:mono/diheme cytochrome c family protein
MLAGALLLAACGGDSDDGGSAESGGDGGELFDGLEVGEFFAATCAPCHGPKREGLIGPALTQDRLTEPDDFYFNTIANGRPGTVMPSWRNAGLSDGEIGALVTWLKTTSP